MQNWDKIQIFAHVAIKDEQIGLNKTNEYIEWLCFERLWGDLATLKAVNPPTGFFALGLICIMKGLQGWRHCGSNEPFPQWSMQIGQGVLMRQGALTQLGLRNPIEPKESLLMQKNLSGWGGASRWDWRDVTRTKWRK